MQNSMHNDAGSLSANGTMPAVELPRADVDIAEEVQQLFRSYPVLHMSRAYMHVNVTNGIVTISGNVRAVTAKRILRDRVPLINGVKLMNLSELYDDEALEIAIAEKMPNGLYANSQYGMVALTGSLPLHVDPQALLKEIAAIPGVRKVAAHFDQG